MIIKVTLMAAFLSLPVAFIGFGNIQASMAEIGLKAQLQNDGLISVPINLKTTEKTKIEGDSNA